MSRIVELSLLLNLALLFYFLVPEHFCSILYFIDLLYSFSLGNLIIVMPTYYYYYFRCINVLLTNPIWVVVTRMQVRNYCFGYICLYWLGYCIWFVK